MALSVVLAKINIINPLILDKVEIDHLVDIELVPLSISNILSISTIKVLQDNNILYYILKIPKFEQIYKNVSCKSQR